MRVVECARRVEVVIFGRGAAERVLLRPVEVGKLGLVDIGVGIGACVPAPQPLVMKAGVELEALPADGALQLSHDVAARTHARGVPAIHAAIPHGKAVGMFGHRTHIARSGILEKSYPCVGVEVNRGEGRRKVLVTEFIQRSISGDVVVVLRPAGKIHEVRVPLIAKGRDGIKAPMEVNAELGVAVPFGTAVLLERLPLRAVRPGERGGLDSLGGGRHRHGGTGCKPLQSPPAGNGHGILQQAHLQCMANARQEYFTSPPCRIAGTALHKC